jgi:adenylylsulfate kinase
MQNYFSEILKTSMLNTDSTTKKNNIFPTNKILQREDKEVLLGQKSFVIWFTGLSGSGKTTVGIALEKELYSKGLLTQILDGDNIRMGINSDLGFSEQDRIENIRRISEVAKLFVNNGVITICCFVSPTESIRDLAKNIIGAQDFIDVYVNAPINICEDRDVKGLYAKARKGEIKNFTGVNAPFETGENCAIELRTDQLSVSECVEKIVNYLKEHKKL